MHASQEYVDQKLAEFTRWVGSENRTDRHRMAALEDANDRLARRMEHILMALTDDVGVILGLVNQFESVIAAQQTTIQQLTAKDQADSDAAAAAAPEHADLVQSHTQLAGLAQQMRDALSALSPATPVADIVAPAPGTTTADPTLPSGGAGMEANNPTTSAPIPGGQSSVTDPTLPEGTVASPTGAPAGAPDGTADISQGNPNPAQVVSSDQAPPLSGMTAPDSSASASSDGTDSSVSSSTVADSSSTDASSSSSSDSSSSSN